jgi:hypothetical protein
MKDEEDLQRIMQLLIARGSNNPEEEAMHHLGLRAQAPKHDKYPGRGIQGTVQASPSTEFQRPYEWSGNKLSSPQSEAEEEFNRVYTSSDSRNVMDEAMALLKGNRDMRDANDRNIDHTAALTYDNLASQVGQDRHAMDYGDYPEETSEADTMAHLKQSRHKQLMDGLKQGKSVSPLMFHYAQHDDRRNKEKLDEYGKNAREQTSNTLAYGNEDNSPSPNYGVERMPRPEED